MIAVLAGGVGAARFLRGLVHEVDKGSVTAIVNVADDFRLHGLWISPDIDTIVYTLAGVVGDAGWGIKDDTSVAMQALDKLSANIEDTGATSWFQLGDRDLATHLYRTQRKAEGAALSAITAELCDAHNVNVRLLPVTDDVVQTFLEVKNGDVISFQEYFVAKQHDPLVKSIDFMNASQAMPAPGVLDTLNDAQVIVIAPSNPFVSIAPVLAIPGVADTVRSRRDRVVAISPIVNGRAIKGPAARMMADFGYEPSVVSIARIWTEFASTLVIDTADAHLRDEVEAQGMRCVTVPTLMTDIDSSRQLARDVLNVT